MRASLPEREPEILGYWHNENVYEKKQAKRRGREKFILHDGPPYANGSIHLGTALNKILKDIIVKYKYLRGFDAPYVPGWDTHGMPIEHAAINNLGLNRAELDPLVLRGECKNYALKWVEAQKEDFKRLGVLGDWERPYITLAPEFEAEQMLVFGGMAEKGYIYKGLKSVYWCPHCETALAEAEIEYGEEKSPAVYVKFPLADDKGALPPGLKNKPVFAVIWTTTPWTLPANAALAVHPDFEYSWVEGDGEIYLFAKELLPQIEAETSRKFDIFSGINGKELEGLIFRHPFLDRASPVVLAGYVTADTGTGIVHTAPGHGPDDFATGERYGLPVISPVGPDGKFTAEGGRFAGLFVFDANGSVIKLLAENGMLFSKGAIRHQYAHCWRCKNKIIYRATEQWFASVDGFREKALAEIDQNVRWIPSWGRERLHNMVADRNDWCISRQRVWGVPIPVFYCKQCGEALINGATVKHISRIFRREGSNAWWGKAAGELMPEGTACPKCGAKEFRKETDIMDVWFDSGSSHAAVLKMRPELKWPASMYLEGSDQHRGWFQSSLLTSVAHFGAAPYESVLTHGFVVDGEGRKMSKSIGNTIYPQEVIKKYGADILRLWVASADYKADIKISNDILKQLSEVYRKIRNTFRYIISNLYDFDPEKDSVDYADLQEIDKWALLKHEQVKAKVTEAYENYEFHLLYHAVHNFCTIDLSSFYLDIIKDRLYSSRHDDSARRSAQTAMHLIIMDLVVMLAPVLSFTTEETWRYMKKSADAPQSVQMTDWPAARPELLNPAIEQRWEGFIELRGHITKALEAARRAKIIGHSLDARVVLYAEGAAHSTLSQFADQLAGLLIVSQVRIGKGPGGGEATGREDLRVLVEAADGEKCERCWIYSPTVGDDAGHPTLCSRCARVLA
jgi:isoleucyl-tRNA synthetase